LSGAFAIGLRNMPEALAVAAALLTASYRPTTALCICPATSLLEGFGGLLGTLAMFGAWPMMPWILGLAAGAMLCIISDKVNLEVLGRGRLQSLWWIRRDDVSRCHPGMNA
jgi:zinc transporter, ZIP family